MPTDEQKFKQGLVSIAEIFLKKISDEEPGGSLSKLETRNYLF